MLKYYLFAVWQAIVDHGLPLLGMLLLAILIPRIGRLAVRVIESRLDENQESTKARLALAGALVYVAQAVAYFLLVLAALANLGVPPLGAAIPATVVSAAVGFGAQAIIGDFLAGFFILSEKQFGVGDYVSFDGVTGVEGTVVSLTLRTTTVRTPTGEVVMVPNGSAGVVTNFSQEWSRAVVDIAIPVHEGESLPEITEQVEKISKRALEAPDIHADVAGELDVLPATGLTAPTAAGQPWQVQYRVLVQVNPARQWAVERAIRSALLSTFWDLYKLPTTEGVPGDASQELGDVSAADAPTTIMPAANTAELSHKDVASDAETEVIAADAVADAGAMPQDSKDDGPGRPAYAGDSEEDEEDDYQRGIWRDDKPDNKWNYFWTLGGRVRASTTGLIVGLGVVGLLLLSSANPDGVDAGWLSPSRWMGQSESTSESAQPSASSSAPLTTPQEVPATDSTGSAEQEPTAEVDPHTPTDSTPDSEAVYAPADPQDAETQAPVEQNSEAPAPTANEQPSAIVSEGAAEPSTVM
ncbi:mechanosensitive ion channel family protein [Corynebacterium aurimucosum]|uniref:mechanosensitive ion channel family protein n=1 Tax=Corynebacterium guaraldiae TaxID=3051103 RepID=UPI0012B97672|nr:mechanosensitive ion channel family protein [Corynebacterium guaraldiae]MTE10974.1 mechanosensitive ion channel family protein [Corynebacterium guaraldiae]